MKKFLRKYYFNLLLLLIVFIATVLPNALIKRSAYNMYISSRAHTDLVPGSTEFKIWNIKYGDSETDVDTKLSTADRVFRRLSVEDSNGNFYNVYYFFFGRGGNILEIIKVEFTEDGQALRVFRRYIQEGKSIDPEEAYELCSGK